MPCKALPTAVSLQTSWGWHDLARTCQSGVFPCKALNSLAGFYFICWCWSTSTVILPVVQTNKYAWAFDLTHLGVWLRSWHVQQCDLCLVCVEFMSSCLAHSMHQILGVYCNICSNYCCPILHETQSLAVVVCSLPVLKDQHPDCDILVWLWEEIVAKVSVFSRPMHDDMRDMKYLRAFINGVQLDYLRGIYCTDMQPWYQGWGTPTIPACVRFSSLKGITDSDFVQLLKCQVWDQQLIPVVFPDPPVGYLSSHRLGQHWMVENPFIFLQILCESSDPPHHSSYLDFHL